MKRCALILLSMVVLLGGCAGGLDDDDFATIAAEPELDSPVVEPEQTAVPVVGNAGVYTPEIIDPSEATFVDGVDHIYMPLPEGREWVYEGTKEGQFRRDEMRILPDPEIIEGVACAARYQEVFLDGELVEQTTEWFAQDTQGNVWKFGEESFEFSDGAWALDEDSWRAGVDETAAWKFLAGTPEVDDLYTDDGVETRIVLSLNETVDVPAGAFGGCLKIGENQDDPDDKDIVIYSPSVGLVSEDNAAGRLELISVVDR